MSVLSENSCAPCDGKMPLLSTEQADELSKQLHADWLLSANSTALTRKFSVKGFAKATYLANLCAWLADREGHHPDVSFGWGYCHVTITTHDVQGLTKNDFIWAAKLDSLTQ